LLTKTIGGCYSKDAIEDESRLVKYLYSLRCEAEKI
jgi:hypothetical protein